MRYYIKMLELLSGLCQPQKAAVFLALSLKALSAIKLNIGGDLDQL